MALTTEDIDLLKSLPMLAGSMVAVIDSDGLIESAKEFYATAKVVSEGGVRYPNNKLIAQLQQELQNVENYTKDSDKPKVKTKSTAVAMEAFVDMVDKALNTLEENVDPTEAHEYKQWVLACAQAGAEAAKEGGFLGIGGKQVSDREAAYLTHLQSRLGL